LGVLTEELLTLCRDLSTCLKANIRALKDSPGRDPIETHVTDWAIVLGVLADDVFESVVTLLNDNRVRGGNMLSRALGDYDVRLRYYVVQSMKILNKYKRKGIVFPKNVKQSIRAARDWENADYKFISVLNLYDPNLWPPEIRAKLDQVLASNEGERNSSFSAMLNWLIREEVRVRGIFRFFSEGVVYRYSNMLPAWRMQSAFLHGDQVIVSDVLEFDSAGKKTGRIFERSEAAPTVILFTSIDNIIELIRSFGMITNSMTPGVEAIRDRAKDQWFKIRKLRPSTE
jgi:hypothetical protein